MASTAFVVEQVSSPSVERQTSSPTSAPWTKFVRPKSRDDQATIHRRTNGVEIFRVIFQDGWGRQNDTWDSIRRATSRWPKWSYFGVRDLRPTRLERVDRIEATRNRSAAILAIGENDSSATRNEKPDGIRKGRPGMGSPLPFYVCVSTYSMYERIDGWDSLFYIVKMIKIFLAHPHAPSGRILRVRRVFLAEMIWVKTVTIHTSTQGTRQATLAATVCANGTKLPPMLIFKGKQNGRITANEFPMFPTGCEYFCRENAWMDEGAMIEWVEKILKPFIATAPGNVVPLFALESYQCNMMASVIGSIQNLGVEVECTLKLVSMLDKVPRNEAILTPVNTIITQ